MVGGVGSVGGGVGEHGVDGGGEGFETDQAGKDRFVADGVRQDKRRPLVDLVSEELPGARLDAGFHRG